MTHQLMRLVPLADTRWLILTPLAVRSTGFPARLLTEVSGTRVPDAQRLAPELRRSVGRMLEIAATTAMREALAWQNPRTLDTFASLARGIDEPGRNAKRRDREHRLVRYLSRYCGKTETIGFFGPLCWAGIGGDGHIRQRPGDSLIRRRAVFAEPWSVRALALALVADPRIGPWFPLRIRTQYAVCEGRLVRPRQAPVTLSSTQAAVLALCDGERLRHDVVAAASRVLGVAPSEVDSCVSEMEHQRWVVTDGNIPLDPCALAVLRRRVAAIRDGAARAAAEARLDRYCRSLAAVGEAAGDADDVRRAQEALVTTFQELTGTAAARSAGQMYAGRGLAYEDCLRDLDVDLGQGFVRRLADALPAVLTISRWLTWATAQAYESHFATAWRDGRPRGLDAVWFEALTAFFGSRRRPVDGVLEEFRRRWRRLLAEATVRRDGAYEPAGFREGVERLFAAPRPGWRSAAVHSPDIQVCAADAAAVRSGDYSLVLGEVHVGSPTITGPVFEWPFGGYSMSAFLQSLTGPRHVPVFPESWSRNTGRTKPFQPVPGDVLYAFDDVEGAPPGTVSVATVTVTAAGGAVTVVLPDGAEVPFAEFFGFFLSGVVIDAWRHLARAAHTARVTVGGLTLLRESWRSDVGSAPFLTARGEQERHDGVQVWRRELGLPDAVYVSLSGEPKPFLVDFRAPASVLSFVAAARAALRRPRASGEVGLSEALPTPEQAWVVDADGERYLGEIRLMVLDGRADRPLRPPGGT
jgi:hypothetical protein